MIACNFACGMCIKFAQFCWARAGHSQYRSLIKIWHVLVSLQETLRACQLNFSEEPSRAPAANPALVASSMMQQHARIQCLSCLTFGLISSCTYNLCLPSFACYICLLLFCVLSFALPCYLALCYSLLCNIHISCHCTTVVYCGMKVT